MFDVKLFLLDGCRGLFSSFIRNSVLRDVSCELQRRTLVSSADFIENNYYSGCRSFNTEKELISFLLKKDDGTGLWAEFGVYKGKSINFIASHTKTTVFGFDCFTGLPEDWSEGYEKGSFCLDKLPKVRKNVRLKVGLFEESIPKFLDWYDGVPFGFIHIDSDLYSSAKTVLFLLNKNIVPGTIILFNEFFNYPGWEQGEYRAFMEFVKKFDVEFEILGYVNNNQQVGVMITSIGHIGQVGK